MKIVNRLIVMLLTLGLFITIGVDNTSATTPLINKEFVKLAKQGKLKGVPGNVNMSFQSLKKVAKGTTQVSETSMLYRTKKATYGFEYDKNFTTKIKSTDKVMLIAVPIKQKVTAAQMGKYFGKTVAYNAYQAGKYYIRYENWDNGATIYLGTKKGLNLMYSADPDGDLFIE